MRSLVACLFTLILMAPGCSSGRNYAVNRVGDIADILRLHVMAGPGVGAKLEATRLIHGGILYERDVFAWGIHDRAIGPWREDVFSWGLVVGSHDENLEGIPRLSGDYGWRFDREGQGGIFQAGEEDGQLSLDLLTFRGTAMLLVGIDIEVRVGEVLDFVAGLFQFDPSGDDIDVESMRKPVLPTDTGTDTGTDTDERRREPADMGDGDYDFTIS